ncbi:MAG: hypothetical protein BroJett025_01970 [Patescibacteria group bacterium]|nr:MAG: hypothetical protein BroJett025_01970 [Patescibacteria group bacterium]
MSNKNPFAAALGSTGGNKSSRSFTEALSSTSGRAGSFNSQNSNPFENNPFNTLNNSYLDQYGGTNGPMQNFGGSNEFGAMQKQQEELKKQEYEKKRLELHKKVNPVDAKDVFDAREEATKKKIDQIRKDLKNLAKEIKKFHKEIDITLMGRVTNTGFEGIGDENFFDRLRAFIILLTQRVRSARTWAKQAQAKKKKVAKRAKGLGKQMSESSGFEQRANMDQFFNSERGDNFGE